jgi:hypothetical protein
MQLDQPRCQPDSYLRLHLGPGSSGRETMNQVPLVYPSLGSGCSPGSGTICLIQLLYGYYTLLDLWLMLFYGTISSFLFLQFRMKFFQLIPLYYLRSSMPTRSLLAGSSLCSISYLIHWSMTYYTSKLVVFCLFFATKLDEYLFHYLYPVNVTEYIFSSTLLSFLYTHPA